MLTIPHLIPHSQSQTYECYICKQQISDLNYFPCKCTGYTRVHKHCVENYVKQYNKTKCDICGENYTIIYNIPLITKIAKFINQISFTNIIFMIFILMGIYQMIAISIIIYLNKNNHHYHVPATNPLYICIGVSAGFELFIMMVFCNTIGVIIEKFWYIYIIYNSILYSLQTYELIINRFPDEPVYRIISYVFRNMITLIIIISLCLELKSLIKKLANEKNNEQIEVASIA